MAHLYGFWRSRFRSARPSRRSFPQTLAARQETRAAAAVTAPLLDVWIPGQPVPKGRARVSRNGGVYTPARTRQYEDAVAWSLKQRLSAPTSGDVRVELEFARKGERRADTDNLVKAVLDAANGVVWADDRQVTTLAARVTHGSATPGVRVRVWELG